MAYLLPIQVKCDTAGCSSAAKQELYNTFNSLQGQFCNKHAKQRLSELVRSEKQMLASNPPELKGNR